MRFEIVIIVITALVIANIYTDGKYLRLALTWKKYYQMIGVGLFGLVLIYLLRKFFPKRYLYNQMNYFLLLDSETVSLTMSTNSIADMGAQSLSLKPSFVILVYPPFLPEKFGAITLKSS